MIREAQMYEAMAMSPGSVNIMPRMSYSRNQVQWVTREQVERATNPFGTGMVIHHYAVDEASDMPDVSGWDVPAMEALQSMPAMTEIDLLPEIEENLNIELDNPPMSSA